MLKLVQLHNGVWLLVCTGRQLKLWLPTAGGLPVRLAGARAVRRSSGSHESVAAAGPVQRPSHLTLALPPCYYLDQVSREAAKWESAVAALTLPCLLRAAHALLRNTHVHPVPGQPTRLPAGARLAAGQKASAQAVCDPPAAAAGGSSTQQPSSQRPAALHPLLSVRRRREWRRPH